jgi:enoyl-CoA hydratase
MYAVGTVKKSMNEGIQMDLRSAIEHEAALFCTTYAVPDTEEGISAFLEKRKPDFKNLG